MEEQWTRQGFALLDAEALFGLALLADAAAALEADLPEQAAFPFASGGPPDGAAPLNQLALHDALRRTEIALDEMLIDGISSNIGLHQDLVTDEAFQKGGVNIHYLEKKLDMK